jgi:hypothetical protein
MWRMPEKPSLERCDSSAEPALVFRTIRATRLSVANYNTTLSSESLETGTASSNSLSSANESLRIDTGSGVISWAQRKPGYQRFPRIWSDSNAFATPATAFIVIGRKSFSKYCANSSSPDVDSCG